MSLSNTGKHVLNSWVTIQTFEELDKNGDEQLDFDEMKGLLRARNPHMKEPDLRFLYNGIDSSHDGFVDLEEFVKFYLASEASDHKGVSSEASDHKSEPKPEMKEHKECLHFFPSAALRPHNLRWHRVPGLFEAFNAL
mmetsp:Transcript_160822/g.285091  ORF Transcript_160822/g.285091 Transcript_160822/m.285091 type:complete len:138 (-) Transcript_160822:570-983(-)